MSVYSKKKPKAADCTNVQADLQFHLMKHPDNFFPCFSEELLYFLFQAFFQGKLKIQGNMGLAMKLKEIQPQGQSKLWEAVRPEIRFYCEYWNAYANYLNIPKILISWFYYLIQILQYLLIDGRKHAYRYP